MFNKYYINNKIDKSKKIDNGALRDIAKELAWPRLERERILKERDEKRKVRVEKKRIEQAAFDVECIKDGVRPDGIKGMLLEKIFDDHYLWEMSFYEYFSFPIPKYLQRDYKDFYVGNNLSMYIKYELEQLFYKQGYKVVTYFSAYDCTDNFKVYKDEKFADGTERICKILVDRHKEQK